MHPSAQNEQGEPERIGQTRMDWDRLRIFHAVAGAGSFTAAGRRLGQSQSAVSRQIKALEESLNVALFTRNARGLVLTDEGRKLFETASRVVVEIEQTEQNIRESRQTASGLLRVSTMITFGAVWLSPHLTEFMLQYPDIDIDLILSDEPLDLSAGEAQVSIRLGDPGPLDLIRKPLAVFHAHAYASPQYLARKGMPQNLHDLDHHDIIRFGGFSAGPLANLDWLLEAGNPSQKRVPRLTVNNLYGVLHAVEAGIGIGVLPDYLVHNRKKLVRLFPDVDAPEYESYYCYPPELRGSMRVGLFWDFLVRQIQAERALL